MHLSILDLATHQVSVVPGSTGKWSPRWSPDGRYIASLSWERPELKVFDFKTEKWSTLAVSDDVNYPGWSQDSQYIYSLVISPGGQDVYRVRVTGGKPERIVNLKDWHFASWDNYSMTLDPTDAPLLLARRWKQRYLRTEARGEVNAFVRVLCRVRGPFAGDC